MNRTGKYDHIRKKLSTPTYQEKIRLLKTFLSRNQNYANEYRFEYLGSRYKNKFPAVENLRRLFVNSLNAAGGDNLNRKGESAKKFVQLTSRLPRRGSIDSKQFFRIFGNISSILGLHFYLTASRFFPDFGKKKVALFFRDLSIIQNFSARHKIFKNLRLGDEELLIPVDIVICTVLNKYFNLKGKYQLNASNDFDFINELAIELFQSDYMLLEDLWYWGYFTIHKVGKTRKLRFNEAKFYTDTYFAPSLKCRKKFEQFVRVIEGVRH